MRFIALAHNKYSLALAFWIFMHRCSFILNISFEFFGEEKSNTFLWKDLTICSDSMSMVNFHFSSWLLFCLLIYLLLVPLGIEHRNFCVLTSMLRPCIFFFLFFIFFRSVLKVCEIVQFRSKRNLTRSSYPLPFETGEVRCALIGTDG